MGARYPVRNIPCTLIKTHILCFEWKSYGGRLSRDVGVTGSVGITTRQYLLSTCMTVSRNHCLYTFMRCMLCWCCWLVIRRPSFLSATHVSNILETEITWGIIPMPLHNGGCTRCFIESLTIFDTKASAMDEVLIQEYFSSSLTLVSQMTYPE